MNLEEELRKLQYRVASVEREQREQKEQMGNLQKFADLHFEICEFTPQPARLPKKPT